MQSARLQWRDDHHIHHRRSDTGGSTRGLATTAGATVCAVSQ